MSKLVATIDKFPGNIYEVFYNCDNTWLNDYLTDLIKMLSIPAPKTEDEIKFNRFISQYLVRGTELSEIPEITELDKKVVSSWAGDIIGTISQAWTIYREEEIINAAQKKLDEVQHTQDDDKAIAAIYKYAEEFNVDYYEMNTGRTYHIQDYNRAKSLGLQTPGITVSENGRIIGYVPEI